MRLLSSGKITPFLGLFALLSILYYKASFVPASNPQGTPKAALVTWEEAPLLEPKQILGRPRPQGPLLTRSFAQPADIVLRSFQGRLEMAVIAERPTGELSILRPSGEVVPLLAWLQEAGGRFALFRFGKAPLSQRQAVLRTLRSLRPLSAFPETSTSRPTASRPPFGGPSSPGSGVPPPVTPDTDLPSSGSEPPAKPLVLEPSKALVLGFLRALQDGFPRSLGAICTLGTLASTTDAAECLRKIAKQSHYNDLLLP